MQGYGADDLSAAMSGLRLQNYDPENVTSRRFDSQAAEDYMNPYTESVLNRGAPQNF